LFFYLSISHYFCLSHPLSTFLSLSPALSLSLSCSFSLSPALSLSLLIFVCNPIEAHPLTHTCTHTDWVRFRSPISHLSPSHPSSSPRHTLSVANWPIIITVHPQHLQLSAATHTHTHTHIHTHTP